MTKIHTLTPLEMEPDSTEVIKYIDQTNTTYADIIHECRLLLLQLKIPGIRKNCQEGNEVAHVLAKEASPCPLYIKLCMMCGLHIC